MNKKPIFIAVLLLFVGTQTLAFEVFSDLDCSATLDKVSSNTYEVISVQSYSGVYSDGFCISGGEELEVALGERVTIRGVEDAPDSGWFATVPFGARAFGDEDDPDIEAYFDEDQVTFMSSTTYYYGGGVPEPVEEIPGDEMSTATVESSMGTPTEASVDIEPTSEESLQIALMVQVIALLTELYTLLLEQQGS